jgi:hypothetical protein
MNQRSTPITLSDTSRLLGAAYDVEEAEKTLAEARSKRDKLIRAIGATGASNYGIAKLAGLDITQVGRIVASGA